jgi:hypothetical protein
MMSATKKQFSLYPRRANTSEPVKSKFLSFMPQMKVLSGHGFRLDEPGKEFAFGRAVF